MAKLYSTEVLLAATVYVVADSEEEALKEVKALHANGLEFPSREMQVADGLFVTGTQFSADMPPVTLSPAMTLYAHDMPYATISHCNIGTVSFEEDFDDTDE